jgi:hypothetical protein
MMQRLEAVLYKLEPLMTVCVQKQSNVIVVLLSTQEPLASA